MNGVALSLLFLGSLLCSSSAVVHSDLNSLSSTPKYSIAVEGVVYCKCQLPGYVEPLDASPVPDVVAMLQCNSSGHGVSASAITDVRGHFSIHTTKVRASSAVKNCKVVVVSSPLPGCDVSGLLSVKGPGAPLKFKTNKIVGAAKQAVYTVGLLKLAPPSPTMCPHHP